MARMAPASALPSFLSNARRFVGQPYEWGGGHDSSRGVQPVDCSGLVIQAGRLAGVNLNGRAQDQQRLGRAVSKSDLRPGDLVFRGNPARHVGIYLGEGKVLHAPRRGTQVRVESFNPNNWGSARRVFEGNAASVANQAADLGRRAPIEGRDHDGWSPRSDRFSRTNERGQTEQSERVVAGLRVGHEGMGVKALQRALTQKGHRLGELDGIYGERTKAAVRAFQRAEGLPATGRADAATLRALGIAAR